MNYYKPEGQLDLSDRIAIETGISSKQSFKKIAELLRRHPSTIAHEVKTNRTFIPGSKFLGKDCKWVKTRTMHHICGDVDCDENCCRCRSFNCARYCEAYVSTACHKFEKAPYVCNTCPQKRLCVKDRYIYSAKHADAAVTRRRSESRLGIRILEESMAELDALVTHLVRKGQPLTHIYAEHAMEVMYTEDDVVEMDTVKGVRESGKRLFTMIFRKNNVMLFPVILTDNGSEFKRVDDLELTETYEYRTSLYDCDPMASWQKGCIEKNHEFIRYAIPKGKSLNPYTQEDMTLLMNHINSVKRPGLGNKSPYELVDEEDVVFHELICLLLYLQEEQVLLFLSPGKTADFYLQLCYCCSPHIIRIFFDQP